MSEASKIDKYIEDNYDNYSTPEQIASLLCAGTTECMFLDIFRKANPGLYFLTAEDVRALSYENYLTNGFNLQLTLNFIQAELKKYYNFVFDIWICFKFTIIERIPDGTTDPQVIQRTITDYLPPQLVNLLYYLFDSIFYSTITRKFPDVTKKAMIQKNVVNVVLLYSRLYIFLQQPDPSLPFFTFNKRNVSLVFLSNVMVYKCFDNLHKISSIIFENYIYVLNEMFRTFVSIFGDTPSGENKQKIDFGLAHVARFLLYLPDLSKILSNLEPRYTFIEIMRDFEKKDIFFVRGANGKIEKTLTLKEVEELKRLGTDVTRFDIRRDIDFNPMSENTLLHAIQFVSAIRIKLNEKQQSSVSEDVVQPMIEDLKLKHERFRDRGYDYFSFLYIFSAVVEQFIQTNSLSKDNKLILRSDFSQCCGKIPNFEIHSIEEEKQMKVVEQRKKIQHQKELEEMRKEEQRRIESALRLDKIKFKKEQQKEKEEERKKAEEEERIAAAAAASPKVLTDKSPKVLTDKEKQLLIVQRNNNFKNDIKSIFAEFSAAIQSGQFQDAASMLNEKLTPKLRLNVPWTAANMEKFSPKMMEAYQALLGPVASPPPAVAPVTPPAVVVTPPSPSPSLPTKSMKSPNKKPEPVKPVQVQPVEPVQVQPQPVEPVQVPEKKSPKLIKFENDIGQLCGGNGHSCFAFMFRCSLKQFFRITTVVRDLSDQAILQIMSSFNHASRASADAAPLTEYMNLKGSGQRIRAFFVLALLNGLRRVEHVRFAFIGRTFLQLLACYSELPKDKYRQLYIPFDTSDFDVYTIFNNDTDPMQYREFIIHIFSLFWRDSFHIHVYQRDDAAWIQFQTQSGHLYASTSRGSPDIVKVSLNTRGTPESIVEVSDIGFKTVRNFTDIFTFTRGSLNTVDTVDTVVDTLQLLNLTYNVDQTLFFTNPGDACSVPFIFEFPDAQSGLVESLRVIIKILHFFLTNQFNFQNRQDFYFIHVSNLLKFIVRAFQFKGISLFQDLKGMASIRLLYESIIEDFHRELTSNMIIDASIKPYISAACIQLIDLFFIADKTEFFDQAFKDADEYRKTKNNAEGASIRITMPLHQIILHILVENGFNDSFLLSGLSIGRNLFGGIAQHRYNHKNNKNNKKYTKKNKKQKMKKTVNKKHKNIKKIKLTISNKTTASSSKKYKKNTSSYKIIKK
jgi:hypothetical protein